MTDWTRETLWAISRPRDIRVGWRSLGGCFIRIGRKAPKGTLKLPLRIRMESFLLLIGIPKSIKVSLLVYLERKINRGVFGEGIKSLESR